MAHPLFGVGGPVIVSGPSTFSNHKSMEIPTKCWSKEIILFNIRYRGDTSYSSEVAVATPMFNFATPVLVCIPNMLLSYP